MTSHSGECEPGHPASGQAPKAERRRWVTPTVIVAKAEGTENASNLPDDGPFSVS